MEDKNKIQCEDCEEFCDPSEIVDTGHEEYCCKGCAQEREHGLQACLDSLGLSERQQVRLQIMSYYFLQAYGWEMTPPGQKNEDAVNAMADMDKEILREKEKYKDIPWIIFFTDTVLFKPKRDRCNTYLKLLDKLTTDELNDKEKETLSGAGNLIRELLTYRAKLS